MHSADGHVGGATQLPCPPQVTSHEHDVVQSIGSRHEPMPVHLMLHGPGPHAIPLHELLPLQLIVQAVARWQSIPAMHALSVHSNVQRKPLGHDSGTLHARVCAQSTTQVFCTRSHDVHGVGQLAASPVIASRLIIASSSGLGSPRPSSWRQPPSVTPTNAITSASRTSRSYHPVVRSPTGITTGAAARDIPGA